MQRRKKNISATYDHFLLLIHLTFTLIDLYKTLSLYHLTVKRLSLLSWNAFLKVMG